jgi:hypothetical protein
MATARRRFVYPAGLLHPEHTIARLLHRIIACVREIHNIIATQSEKKQCVRTPIDGERRERNAVVMKKFVETRLF